MPLQYRRFAEVWGILTEIAENPAIGSSDEGAWCRFVYEKFVRQTSRNGNKCAFKGFDRP